jgi:hypothetical protein
MQINAMSSATAGMYRAGLLMDTAAAQVSADSAATADAVSTGLPPPSAGGDEGLLTAVPNMLLAGVLMKANVAVAQTADETYRAALDLVAPRAGRPALGGG